MKIHIINGPNLNLLGKREPDIYGYQSFHDYLDELQEKYKDVEISYFQSNSEGELISELQESDDNVDGIIINAAAYTHTSIGIADAIRAIETPAIEVHISNVFQREKFRHRSFIASHCIGSISGFGLKSYELAIQSLV
ncbi:MAG: type II 3-dehydroquinate dehydratase [Psychroflexus sp.]|jgi:3-dehydroquinate dehydratase-2|nr:type II 3-dehydroquinate dehydratase [Psychroflexus sp.]MDR9447731.1 type II 3-dehydroquinate dehydratase [Psychroflexus sp.]